MYPLVRMPISAPDEKILVEIKDDEHFNRTLYDANEKHDENEYDTIERFSRNKERKDKLTVRLLAGAPGRSSILGIELGPGLSSRAGVVRVAQVQGHNGR
ncbi:PREDICTED: uncharacterized protein LOC105559026 isoform X2 [Vollenhovia emeryi]|uniref:uncharacterized protein LOC105559026 isoform X2 n=1 Tax=Vollenhovia emeryi TaxID=411798 RepID=UPI0005F3A353|nr:PREDICTED: uncharacterized protein LOC105559026 isoform X2 [Vollenhovia emeryi]